MPSVMMNVRPNVGSGMNANPDYCTRMTEEVALVVGYQVGSLCRKIEQDERSSYHYQLRVSSANESTKNSVRYGQVCSPYIGRLPYAATPHYGIADSVIVNYQSTQLHTTKLWFGLQAAPRQSSYLPLSWYDFVLCGRSYQPLNCTLSYVLHT